MEDLLQVGIITSPHGVRGEVKVYPTTDDIKRFSKLKEVYLAKNNNNSLLHIRNVKYYKNMVILGFEEFNSMDEAEALRQCSLLVDRRNAVKLQKDEYFIADLIGLNIIADKDDLTGELKEVIRTGANDVYVIELKDGRELLLPAIADCVLNVDIQNREMKIHILDGLLD